MQLINTKRYHWKQRDEGMVGPKQKRNAAKRSYPARIRKAVDAIVRGYSPRQVWLYGSFARGDFHEGSDIDLIIIKESDKRFIDRIDEVLQYCPAGVAVEPLVYTSGEKEAMLAKGNTFLEQAFAEGVLVYEQKP